MKIKLLAVVMIYVLLLSACGTSAKKNNLENDSKKITAEEAYDRMNSGDEITILDVRTQEEYDTVHIPGAILIPNEEIGDTKPDQLPDLDAEILVYCRSGNRSAQAAKKLVSMGYTNIYDFGGINDWNYETESGNPR
ncbi:MAG: rhodanese-like domain-containing protein [Lachnospiraceae bacterium]|nr:rhodanese-like domain-containing protein [Lachnospiraceae bacterium]MDD3616743.1 rhodanese-like domain-containing protein [Lachnospiraceae bacterium]